MDTTLHVVCDNPECYYVGQIRHVPAFVRIAPGLYTRRSVYCECRLTIELRLVAAAEPITPSLADEFAWALQEPPC